jgi:hypothetical protein
MDPQRESQRHLLKDYYTKYYAELRRQLPKYAAASEQVPPFLRSHARIITISECADGYVITHRTNPTTAGDAAETFVMIADDWDRTVGDATGKDYDPYSAFDESEAPFARGNEWGVCRANRLRDEGLREQRQSHLADGGGGL